jgi:hypothetical protein
MATPEKSDGHENLGRSKIQPFAGEPPTSAHARKGTGPRTKLGKERSRHNARAHGIFSTIMLKGESQAEFDLQLNGLRRDFQPVGTLEEGLVETLAVTRWRQRRHLVAEAAEVEAGREFLEWDDKERRRIEAGASASVSSTGGLVRKIDNAEVLEACLSRLRVLKIGIETNGFDLDKDVPTLTVLYGDFGPQHWQPDLFGSYQLYARVASLPDTVREQSELPPPGDCRRHFLNELEQEIARLHLYDLDKVVVEHRRAELEFRRRNVPDSSRLDQLMRYSITLERTFDRTLTQLERAQRMRRGQPVAPQLDVKISSS